MGTLSLMKTCEGVGSVRGTKRDTAHERAHIGAKYAHIQCKVRGARCGVAGAEQEHFDGAEAGAELADGDACTNRYARSEVDEQLVNVAERNLDAAKGLDAELAVGAQEFFEARAELRARIESCGDRRGVEVCEAQGEREVLQSYKRVRARGLCNERARRTWTGMGGRPEIRGMLRSLMAASSVRSAPSTETEAAMRKPAGIWRSPMVTAVGATSTSTWRRAMTSNTAMVAAATPRWLTQSMFCEAAK